MTSDFPAILGGRPVRPEGPPAWPGILPLARAALLHALDDGSWGRYHGPNVPRLARQLAQDHNLAHALPCASGTAAMELALRGVGVGPGDEVILSAYDFRANLQNVLLLGAVPVLVDVLEASFQLDVAQVEAAIGPATRAVIASHLHRGVVDMPALARVTGARGVALIEDAAQAPLARIHGRVAGGWGDASILSFGGSKLVTAGRGGAVLTGSDAVAQRIRLHVQRGNEAYPLSELQAAALLPQWQALETANARRHAAAEWLIERLAPLGVLEAFSSPAGHCVPGCYKLGFRYHAGACGGLPRELFAAAVRAEGVALDPGFRALHKSHSSRRYRAFGPLPGASGADQAVLTLHHPVLLEAQHALEQVIEACRKVQRHAGQIARCAANLPLPGDAGFFEAKR
jgi:dTDP-4-amino-4,6-dideoxygalactose transaminase